MLANKIILYNKVKYNLIIGEIDKEIASQDMNAIHHIWRITLQMSLVDKISVICREVLRQKNEDMTWGKSYFEDNFGTTVVTLHRLIWSLNQLRGTKYRIEDIILSISKSIEMIINNHDIVYKKHIVEKHGLIDRLHHLTQVEYYIVKYNDIYHFVNEEKLNIIKKFLYNDTRCFLNNQCDDGGWHEQDRIRSRIGTAADAIRGLIMDDTYKVNVKKGIKFLINNQNPYYGYWEIGNVDKMFDALKCMLNSLSVIDDDELKERCKISISKGIEWLLKNYDNSAKLAENDYDLYTITLDYEKIIINNEFPEII